MNKNARNARVAKAAATAGNRAAPAPPRSHFPRGERNTYNLRKALLKSRAAAAARAEAAATRQQAAAARSAARKKATAVTKGPITLETLKGMSGPELQQLYMGLNVTRLAEIERMLKSHEIGRYTVGELIETLGLDEEEFDEIIHSLTPKQKNKFDDIHRILAALNLD